MHPAPSLIAFTTLSGAGFGLLALLGLGFGPSSSGFGWAVCIIAGLLCVIGLLSSTMHLARPDRAWRAMSQWRSSWLSREGVLAIATLLVFALYGLGWLFGSGRSALLGVVMKVLSIATVYATGMIYAQLKTVPRWSCGWTPWKFLALGLSSGSLVLMTLIGFAGERGIGTTFFAAAALAVAAWVVFNWRVAASKADLASVGATPEEATGLGHIGRVRLLESPHSSPNYLMKEMVYQVARHRAESLARVALVAGLIVPAVLLLLAFPVGGGFVLFLAAVCHVVGILALRWSFFAEAKHAVSSYY
ncbi:MAG: DmsC/YnfH family molybdoenzyme membrane anchor subunit [Pseudomonadota bacterium]